MNELLLKDITKSTKTGKGLHRRQIHHRWVHYDVFMTANALHDPIMAHELHVKFNFPKSMRYQCWLDSTGKHNTTERDGDPSR